MTMSIRRCVLYVHVYIHSVFLSSLSLSLSLCRSLFDSWLRRQMASLMSLYQQGHSLQQERKPAAVAAAKSQASSVVMSAWDVGL